MADKPDVRARMKPEVAQRRLNGVYRQSGEGELSMIRLRASGGSWSADKLCAASQLAERFGNGRLHFTTRGDVQLYGIASPDVDQVLSQLEEMGLSSRATCGNTVRNVFACPGTAVCPEELVDSLEIADLVWENLRQVPSYEDLPRKFKISISGCDRDCAVAKIQDIGIVATRPKDYGSSVGFHVYLAGGLGRRPQLGWRVPQVIHQSELIPFIRATIDLYNELGDRKHPHRARMKFLVESMGRDKALEAIKERLADKTWGYEI